MAQLPRLYERYVTAVAAAPAAALAAAGTQSRSQARLK